MVPETRADLRSGAMGRILDSGDEFQGRRGGWTLR